MFAFIGKSTHNCRFISLPGSIEVPFGVRLPPLPFYRSGDPAQRAMFKAKVRVIMEP